MISVVVPTGDRTKVPQTTWDGIDAQTYDPVEKIVIEGPNCWVNRNSGARIARGEFFFFCDDDITLDPTCFEKLHAALVADDTASYAYCDYSRSGLFEGTLSGRRFNEQELKMGNYISSVSLIRRRDFELTGWPEDVPRLADWDYWLTLLELGKYGVHVPETLFNAHFSEGDISTRGQEDYRKAVMNIKSRHPRFFLTVPLNG